jgi:predicted CXXCH cytochrome family protein
MFYRFLILFFSFSSEIYGEINYNNDSGNYVGSRTCLPCHKSEYSSWVKTYHSKTSGKVVQIKLPDTFKVGSNNFNLDKDHYLSYSKNSGKYYETLHKNGKIKHQLEFEYFLGSGKYGQNYLSKLNQRFYRLKTHYLPSVNDWSLMPGVNRSSGTFPLESPPLRCFQCHTTHMELESSLEPLVYSFKEWERMEAQRYKEKTIWGVGCESCHGPGEKHIKFHKKNIGQKLGMSIQNPGKFSRDRSLDTCRLCHSGIGQLKYNFYSFRPGDNLNDFITFNKEDLKSESVHSNNHVPLEQSKCFQKSKMTCLTCHDPHKNNRGQLKSYSQICIQCHNKSHESSFSKKQKENCIDCHMPLNTFDIEIETKNIKKGLIRMRSHLIKIYSKKSELKNN